MGHIFYLMGKSSSGKDTIYKKLMEDPSLGLKNIVLYTTRPIRVGEEDGREYFFVDEERLKELQEAGKVIELRSYDTCLGVWKYFTVSDENIDLTQNNYLMIGTIESFVKTKEYYGKDTVIPLMIELSDGIRLRRALGREDKQENPKYSEMCRRFLADEQDFAPEKMVAAGIEKTYVNEHLDVCLSSLNAEIRKWISK